MNGNGISQETKQELTRAISASTRDMIAAVSKDIRNDIAALDKAVALSASKLDDLVNVIKPIPEQIVRMETQLEGMNRVQNNHWVQISKLNERMQKSEIGVAANAPKVVAFWDSSNVKYALILITLLITIIGGLAGMKMSSY